MARSIRGKIFMLFSLLHLIAQHYCLTPPNNIQEFENTIAENTYLACLFVHEPRPEMTVFMDIAVESISDVKYVVITNNELVKKYAKKKEPTLVYFREKEPILYTGAVGDTETLVHFLTTNKEVSFKKLNDETFEHLTQAATGATTGDWLVMFYEPHCSSLMPVWDAVASRIKQRMNAATVDTAESPALKKRFKIKTCPAVLFFRLGKFYRYEFKEYSVPTLAGFAEGFYKNVKGERVPGEPTPFDKVTQAAADALKSMTSQPWWLLKLLCSGSVVTIILISIVWCWCCGSPRKGKAE